ncbi:hypothetical protein D3C81_1995260 [compost metagenome]
MEDAHGAAVIKQRPPAPRRAGPRRLLPVQLSGFPGLAIHFSGPRAPDPVPYAHVCAPDYHRVLQAEHQPLAVAGLAHVLLRHRAGVRA